MHGVLHLCGYDHETDDGEMLALQRPRPGAAVTPLGLRRAGGPAERGQVDAREPRSSAARWRSSPTSRRPPGARSAGSRPARTGSSCWSTCRASSARATRSPSACSARSSARSRDADAALFVLNGEQEIGAGRPLHRRGARNARRARVVTALNKVDRLDRAAHASPRSRRPPALDVPGEIFPVSALEGAGVGELRRAAVGSCPRARSSTRRRTRATCRERCGSPSWCASRCCCARARSCRTRSRSRSTSSRSARTGCSWCARRVGRDRVAEGHPGRRRRADGAGGRHRRAQGDRGAARAARPPGAERARPQGLAPRRGPARPAGDR